MIKSILKWLAIGIVAAFILLWLFSGGIGKAWNQAKLFTNPFKDGFSGAKTLGLPWQPTAPVVKSVNEGAGGGSGTIEERDPEAELEALQEEYEDLDAAIQKAKEFGTPSPYRYEVRIEKSAAARAKVQEEYIRITAASDNTSPINITGWSLQSALTGVRVYIPRGAENFLMGAVNVQSGIQLAPGASAIAVSGQSPIGTSFRENICTGYLNQMQTFVPELKERCPVAAEVMPLTAANLQTYGDACVDFVKRIPSCESPIEMFTPALSPMCQTYLANTLSYNGCVERTRYRSDFANTSWRIYLNASGELWRNTHDVIRLLDAEGRTVAAITY